MGIDETLNLDATPYADSIDGAVSSLDRLDAAQQRVDAGATKMSDSMSKAMSGGQPGIMSQAEATELFGGTLDKVGAKAGDFISKISGLDVTTVASAAGLAAIAKELDNSVSKAGGFQTEMTKASQLTGESMKGLTDIANTASEGTSHSLSETGQDMINLADNGIRTKDMLDTLRASFVLSSASTLDMNGSTGALSQTMLQFHLNGTQAMGAANTFVAASQKGKTSTEDMVAALRTAGPVAANAGLSFDDTATALSSMTGEGIRARTAGTDLVQILTKFETPNKQVAAGLKELGISASSVDPNLHSMSDIMQTLADHNLTAAQATEMFGQQVGAGLMAMEGASGGFSAYEQSITGTTAAQDAAAKASDTYEKNLAKLNTSIEKAEITMGNMLLPAVNEVTKAFTAGVGGINDYLSGLTQIVDTAGELATAAGVGGSSTNATTDTGFNSFKFAHDATYRATWAAEQKAADDANATIENKAGTAGILAADAMASKFEGALPKGGLISDKMAQDMIDKAKKTGTDSAFAMGQAMLDKVKDMGVSEQLWAGLQSGMSTADTVAMINRQTSQADQSGAGWKSTKYTTTAGAGLTFALGQASFIYGMGREGGLEASIRFPDGTDKALDNATDPGGQAVQFANEWLAHKGQEALTRSQAEELKTGLKLTFPIAADFVVTTDHGTVADNLKTALDKALQDLGTAKSTTGGVSKEAIDQIQSLYKKILTMDPSKVSDISGANLKLLNTSMTQLVTESDKLGTMEADHASMSATEYWTKYNDSYQHGRQHMLDEMGTTTDLVNAETDKLIPSFFQMFDPTLYHTTEWQDAGKKIGDVLQNGAIDSFQEKDVLLTLRDQFAKEGDQTRVDFMNHILNGDWSLDKLEAVGAQLGMAINIGVKKTLDIFGNTIPDAMKGFDLTQYLLHGTGGDMIANTKDFVENVFQPALKDSVTKISTQLNMGMVNSLQPASDFINNLMLKASQQPDLVTFDQMRTLEAYRAHLIGITEAYDRLAGNGKAWTSVLDDQAAVFAQHQVAFDMYYGLNKNSVPYAQGQLPTPGIENYKTSQDNLPGVGTNYFYGQPIPVTVVGSGVGTTSGGIGGGSFNQPYGTGPSAAQIPNFAGTAGGLTQIGFNTRVTALETIMRTSLTQINTSVQLIETTGIGVTLVKGMAKSVTDIGTANTKEFTDLKAALVTDTGTITTSIKAGADSIVQSIALLMAALVKGAGGLEGGVGGANPLGSAADYLNSGLVASGVTPVFATGGDFITNGARLIMVGEAGPEHVSITPLSSSRASANMGLGLETSKARNQLTEFIRQIEANSAALTLQLKLEFDTYALQTMIQDAIKEAMKNVKVR